MKGILISFEGIDGCGKSTQISLLYKKLISLKLPVIQLREPGGTDIGENIRSFLLDNANSSMCNITELFLYLAARSQISEEVIRPALSLGKIVLMDRFIDSTVAYQGFARNIGIERTREFNTIATGGLVPDLTFLLDCDPAFNQLSLFPDRLESNGISFMAQVRQGYLMIAQSEPSRVKVLNAHRPAETIAKEVYQILLPLIKPQ